jgi:hypothetical protein
MDKDGAINKGVKNKKGKTADFEAMQKALLKEIQENWRTDFVEGMDEITSLDQIKCTLCLTWDKTLYKNEGVTTKNRAAMNMFQEICNYQVVELDEKFERRWTSENVMRELFKCPEVYDLLRKQNITNLLTIGMGNSKTHMNKYELFYERDANEMVETFSA